MTENAPSRLRLLIVEDSLDDALLIKRELVKKGHDVVETRVDNAEDLQQALDADAWDIALLDYNLPGFDFSEALAQLRQEAPETPVIVVTGSIGEYGAVDVIKEGAFDLVMKGQLSRLAPAITRALNENRLRQERDDALKRLKISEERFRSFAELGADWYWEMDESGRYSFLSPHPIFEIGGGDHRDLIGLSRDEFARLMGIGPEEIDHVGRQLANGESISDHTVKWNHPELGERWIKFSVKPVQDEKGSPVCYRGAAKDITHEVQAKRKIRRAEKVMRTMINFSPSVVVLNDMDGRYVLVNAIFRKWLGLRYRDIVGKHPSDFGSAHPLIERFAAISEEVRRTETAITNEEKISHPDGSTRYYLVIAYPIHDEEGRLIQTGIIGFDATEHRLAKQELAEQHALLRAIAENTPASIRLKNLEGQYLLANKQAREFHGLSEEEILGRTAADLIEDERAVRRIERRDRQIRNRQSSVTYEEAIRDRNGQTRHYVVTGFPVLDDAGNLTHTGMISIDITEQRTAERELAASEMRYKTILDHAPLLISMKDVDGNYVLLNKNFREHFKVGHDARSTFDVFDAERAERYSERCRRVMESGRSLTAEERFADASGANRDYLITYFPVYDSSGALDGVGAISFDITDRREMERELRLRESQLRGLLNHAPMAINVKDVDGTFRLANPIFCRIYGRTEERVVGRSPSDIYPVDKARTRQKWIEEILKDGHAITAEEEVAVSGDGLHTFLTTHFPILNNEGEIVQIGAIGVDVSERRATEKHLRQAQKMEAVGQLTAGIAHDFNNLLSVIIGNARMLHEDLGREDEHGMLASMIEEAGRQGADLTDRLLTFGRRHPLDPQQLNVERVLDDLSGLLRRTLGENISLIVSAERGLRQVYADKNQLEAVLLNLAINARDAMPDGGTLTIEAESVRISAKDRAEAATFDAEPGRYVAITMRDTGVGIPAEIADRVLEPFFTTKEAGKGSGMGLSTAYGFAKQSHGDLIIESEEGAGTSVILYLPEAARFQNKAEVRRPDSNVYKEKATGNEKILVVEDNSFLRRWVVDQLTKLGYRVEQAASADEATKIIEKDPGIDLLFSDIVMPGEISGLALAEAVRKDFPEIKVLLTTGYAEWNKDEYRQFAKEGHVLRKPYDVSELAFRIREILDQP